MKLISFYLTNRKQYVHIAGVNSSVKDVKVGAPQGSVLGPFLFTDAINDLPNNLSVKSIKLAYDTSLFTSDKIITELQKSI